MPGPLSCAWTAATSLRTVSGMSDEAEHEASPPSREIVVFTGTWYPGHGKLLDVVEAAREKLGDKVPIGVIDVDDDIQGAEEGLVVSIPTVVLRKHGDEKRRITGAIGLPEVLGLAGVRSRARKV